MGICGNECWRNEDGGEIVSQESGVPGDRRQGAVQEMGGAIGDIQGVMRYWLSHYQADRIILSTIVYLTSRF